MFQRQRLGDAVQRSIVGAKLVFPGPKMGDPATLAALIEEEGVTHAAGVPTVWTGLSTTWTDRQARADVEAHSRGWLGSAAEDDPRFRPEARHRRAAGAGA